MPNFVQRQVARESAGSDNNIDSLSAIQPVEENLDQQLAELTSEEAGLDALEQDGAVLAADTERTEAAVEVAVVAEASGEELSEETVNNVEVAQESIRRRWGCSSSRVATESYRRSRGRTKAAAESWKDTLKDLYGRFVEFLKTVRNKIKDLRLKYFNVGKTAQARSKAYIERLRKLGKKKNDNVSGSFITKLSVNGVFDLDGSIKIAQEVSAGGKAKQVMDKVKTLADGAIVLMSKDGDNIKFKAADGTEAELFGNASTKLTALPQFEDDTAGLGKVKALPGNAYLQAAGKKLEGADYFILGFTTTGENSTEKQIDTPANGLLSKAATALGKIGKDYEKLLQDFRTYDSELEKLEKEAEKAAASFDKATEDDARKALSAGRTVADAAVRNHQTAFRAANHSVRTVIDGLNGYCGAGIGAYESK